MKINITSISVESYAQQLKASGFTVTQIDKYQGVYHYIAYNEEFLIVDVNGVIGGDNSNLTIKIYYGSSEEVAELLNE